MDFFQNNVFLGSVSNAPFTLIWSNVLSGDYTLGAKAVDATGISRAAPPVTIPVLPANDAFADRIVIPGSDAVIHVRGMKAARGRRADARSCIVGVVLGALDCTHFWPGHPV